MPTSSNPVTSRYYPRLSEVITVDDLPEFLHFAETGLDLLLDSIHYKNLQYSRSARGDAAFYSLDIVGKNIGIDLPFGLRLVLNPDDAGDSSISSFPVSLQYQWQILAFLRSFNLPGFSYAPDGFYALGLQVFRISDSQVIANTLNFFVTPGNDTTTVYQQMLDDINLAYPGANLTLPAGQTPTVSLLADLITENAHIPHSVSELMFGLYISDTDLSVTKTKLQRFFNIAVPDGIEDYISKLLVPQIKASLSLSAGIEFPTTMLQPVTADGTVIPNTKTVFKFIEATFYVDTRAGIGTQLELGGSLIPQYSQIANTGLIISFTNAKLDLSRTTNIPEADAAGYPVDFMGLYVQQASITFGKFGSDDTANTSTTIYARNFLIGTGGVSGTIGIDASGGSIYRKFGSFGVELDTFAMTFRQNVITGCAISGLLMLPDNFTNNGNPPVIGIDVNIKDSGDFSITAKALTVLPVFTLPNVFTLSIRSLTLGEQNGRFFVAVAGTLDFIVNLPVLGQILPKGILINKLVIWENGDIEFEGGGLVVPKAFKLSVGPVKLEVSHLALGSVQRNGRNYYYFGFDGMVNTGAAGLEATGNGIKYYFTHDHGTFDQFLSIDGLEIDITIPGDASKEDAIFILQGYLSMKNPDPGIATSTAGTEYAGKVSFSLPKLDISGSAAMQLTPSIPSFLVDIGIELSTAIPLGGTGLGIYGFRGLIGQHYIPSWSATHPPSHNWWEYYKTPSTITHKQGIEIDKFANQQGYSIGAGVSIATEFDSGFIFSSKLFLLLGVPGAFVLQGQAGIIRKRLGLMDDADPPFSAAVLISPQSFETHLALHYNLPDSGSLKGWLIGLDATFDVGFSYTDSSAWYINLGRDTPDNARVSARLLTLFDGYAYLMLSSQGIKAGAGIQFSYRKTVGPVGVYIEGHIDLGGHISFKPVQIGGYINAGGSAGALIFGKQIGLSAQLVLAVEVPSPFHISGSVEISVRLFFFRVSVTIEVGWHKNNNDATAAPLPVLALPDGKDYVPVTAVNILTNEVFPVNYVMYENMTVIPPPTTQGIYWKHNFLSATDVTNVTIPLDSFIDIELLKPVIPGSFLGGAENQLPDGYSEMIPPQKGISNQNKHQYEVASLDIYAWSPALNSWQPYNVYEAVTAIVSSNAGPDAIDLSQLKPGYWQFTDKNKYNKIRLLSQNMFSYANGSDKNLLAMAARNFKNKDIFCYETVQKEIVVNWKLVAGGTVYPPDTPNNVQLLTFTFNGVNGRVSQDPSFNNLSLRIDGNQGQLDIRFPSPIAVAKLNIGDNQNHIVVDFIKIVPIPMLFGRVFEFDEVVSSVTLVPGQQQTQVAYNNVNVPIDHVRLTFIPVALPDYEGNIVFGGHYQLPANLVVPGLNPNVEQAKGLMFATWYNQSFTGVQVLALDYQGATGVVAQWRLDTLIDGIHGLKGFAVGRPAKVPGFYAPDAQQVQQQHQVYYFVSVNDAVIVPYDPLLKVENSSFSFEVTAEFSPFSAGISTLLYKVKQDPLSGNKRGYSLHLVQTTAANPATFYNTGATVPAFSILLTCYSGKTSSAITATESYTVDCNTSKVSRAQYKRILISVNRETGKVDVYIDKVLKISADIPAELAPYAVPDTYTYLDQLSYVTGVLQRRVADNGPTPAGLLNEVQILSDTINKTVQPVWRPNTIFAIKITTQDRVNDSQNVPSANIKTHIFGFKTAGPLGHFHQQSAVYKALADADKSNAFKLSTLQSYIDYQRSYPDAQGRYNLSKPVLCHDPQVKLFFTQPYLNAMFSNWDSYLGMEAVSSSLQLQLIDTGGNILTPQLVWEPPHTTLIDDSNYTSLPADQQLLYLFNRAASQGGCDPMSSPLLKTLRRATYHFDDLQPNRLYTALFTGVYGANNDAVEVYKFSFISSRYATFTAQAGSYVLDATAGSEKYAVYKANVAFTQDYIDNTLKLLIDNDPTDDPAQTIQYSTPFDRMVFGGLKQGTLEPFNYTVIRPVINADPADAANRKILGVIVYNPEPFNDPKLPSDALAGTVAATLTLPDTTIIGPDQFITIYSRDNSAVFITNTAMNIPSGSMQLSFIYKIFDGTNYVLQEQYDGPGISITAEM
ncbi:hypothetical protein BEL04_08310 [Mucilaginibacter sp. PPCGB 2223]|uniref:hypothetical protein n=1 Tax=Mucilaginibacter sp. PPCGB 2223 TaxID=1886027 RepID=UPI0008245C61|nr:hypothetical protein [Mucilaginibacter sp. PPCGB 2223]OCX54250.1 hypothetical protein BEL04_08310 [Mucilaginibacter sp. PPCGB 2223]